ncbi:DNA helicase [Cellulomonas flavigena DSM 20109]|uniref:DNA helicase n=1 Tax=Cellulomonas flavigena (strain ATCC 482 / DSM 20109 / BCRC 11376 / JCM 18109 / NBRC 3775 / NCIMB 8073 / NRS 134) TaxID=446466 RepID=D5UJZ9_CELFN|nr:hypothetical protein [Cellulomonas flavigena]ADG73741.1 DNA helicase [Cellulomonas flavigena DSM 20109]
MSSAERRPRRAVRPPGTVGTDESVLRSVLPAAGAASAPGAAPGGGATAPTSGAVADDLWRRTRSADDSDHGWGREEPSSNDDRLRREKPPHW